MNAYVVATGKLGTSTPCGLANSCKSRSTRGCTPATIRENVALREAIAHRKPIRTYRPSSTGKGPWM
jgi:hypothetical protein